MMHPGEGELRALLQRGFRYALSLTHDEDSAADLVQEACIRVSRAGGPWHAGYLFAAIRNRFFDLGRRAARMPMLPLDAASVEEPSERPDGLELEAALALLRPEEREALYLMSVEGYTAQELAQLLGKPRGTILSLAHRARLKLRRLLREDVDGVAR